MPSLETELRFVKGVGPRRAEMLAGKGLRTVEDLLYHLPFRYEDRSQLLTLRAAREGEVVTVRARVRHSGTKSTRRRRFSVFTALLDDGTASLRAVFFNKPYLETTLARDVEAIFHGRMTRDPAGALQLDNPDFEVLAAGDEASWTRIVPIHVKLPGLTPRAHRLLLERVLAELPASLPETLPSGLAARRGLVDRRTAFHDAHFPPAGADVAEYQRRSSPAHARLVYEELFAMQAAFLLRRLAAPPRPPGRRYETSRALGERLRALLPFRLTAGQRAAFKDIVADLQGPVPMARLLQGDVGSGKTIVALLAMLVAAENGRQAALMAPTEILAEQHAAAFARLLGDAREVGLLTGSARARSRRETLRRLAAGELRLVVGTHALVQDAVRFHDLALVVIDEQHRFGIEQRSALAGKGEGTDVLVMSATPIPRTLALTLHGDLDVTTMGDRPPGRKPVRTVVRAAAARTKVVRFVDDEVAAGRQAFVVHPVIDESEEDDLLAAQEGAQAWARALRGRRVGLVHGRLPADERDDLMRRFAAGALDVLVATTVIEVGIDVPNASVMVIENAERFGLSQLHQLRGRVGRGPHASWCILMEGPRPTDAGRERLALLAATEDGFALAEADLRMRGAGELFGARQAGARDLRVADPVRDASVLLDARREAERWLAELGPAGRAKDPLVRAILERWAPAVERSSVG